MLSLFGHQMFIFMQFVNANVLNELVPTNRSLQILWMGSFGRSF